MPQICFLMKKGVSLKKTIPSPAPLWKRVCAYLIDALIISVVVVLPLSKLYDKTNLTASSWRDALFLMQQGLTFKTIIVSLAIAIITILYWTLLEYKTHQTPGKMLLNIKVISAREQLAFSQCLLRNLTKFSTVLLFLDTLYMIKAKHRRFCDTLADTFVVEKENKKA